jgi:nicotinamidase-related amidase
MTIARLTPLNSTLLVIDVQDKLLVKMPDAPALIRDVAFLIDAARLLEVPVRATEQYPKGLGPTNVELSRRLPPDLPSKVAFSCGGAPGLLSGLQASHRPNVVLAGMETHVCVMQTALDLLDKGLTVFLPVDALQARSRLDHDVALRRMEKAGAVLTSAEATAFEWLHSADHPQFKTISKMIQERMAAMTRQTT